MVFNKGNVLHASYILRKYLPTITCDLYHLFYFDYEVSRKMSIASALSEILEAKMFPVYPW